MLYKDMEPGLIRREYWTERNGLAQAGNLARSVTTPRGRRTAARLTGAKLYRFDLICAVAKSRGIDLLEGEVAA